MFKVK